MRCLLSVKTTARVCTGRDVRLQPIDVLCVGVASYDFVFSVDQHPGPDEKTSAGALIHCGGGPAANASVMVARMGLKSAFAGYLGSDLFGWNHLEELRSAGVNTGLVVRGEHPTPVSGVIVKPSGERSVVNYRSAESILPRDIPLLNDIHPRVILFDGHEPELSAALMNQVRDLGITTVLDAGSLNKGASELFDKVDYLVCSERFAHQFSGASSPDIAMEKLILRARSVVITLGKNGLIWKNRCGEGRFPAFEVDAQDTTGAGDAFHGAFAGCLAKGMGWNETLIYSSAAAALCCTKLGARAGIPEGAEVEKFLRQGRAAH
ncbi:MAG: carbohydrate kinase [Deltaproteobacteria bacterium]|nr:carbohydrate kinase [Deltaproteobacteria bacterium]